MKDKGKLLPAAIFFLACACFVFRHQIASGSRACVDDGIDLYDFYPSVWILCWMTHALCTDPISLFGGNILYPAKYALCLSEYGPGLQLLFAPAYLLTNDPNIAFTIFGILGCLASSMSAYFVTWKWFGRHLIATIAGLYYGFVLVLDLSGPVYSAAWWWPLSFYYFVRAIRRLSWKDAFKSALFTCLNGLSSLQFLIISLFFLTFTAICLLAWNCITAGRKGNPVLRARKPSGPLSHPAVIALATMALAVTLTVPFYLPYIYLAVSGVIGPRPAPYTMQLSSNFFDEFPIPGIFAPLLVLSFFLAPKLRRTRLLGCIAINTICAYVFSRGPVLVLNGLPTFVPLPYCLFIFLPILNFMRAPYRFLLLGWLFFAVLAGVGAYALLFWIGRRAKIENALKHPAVALILACLILPELDREIQTLFTHTIPSPAEIAPCYQWLAKAPDTTIVAEYPTHLTRDYSDDALYTYMACLHWHKIVNGLTSYHPLSYEPFTTRNIDSLPCPSAFENLAALGITHVFVHTKLLPAGLKNVFGKLPLGLQPDTMGDDLIVPLDSLRKILETKGEHPKQLARVSIAAGNKLALPAGTTVRLSLPVRYDGAIWTNTRPNFSERIKVRWTNREPSTKASDSTMECFLPPFLRNGVEDVATCTLYTPDQAGMYDLDCKSGPAWLGAFKIDVDLVGTDKPTAASPKAALSFAGPLEVTKAGGPLRMQVQIANSGTVPLLEQVQVNFNPANFFDDLSAGRILRPADAYYSAWETGNVVQVRPEWIDSHGKTCKVELNDDGCLPAPLYPGTTIELPITMLTPSNPGKYNLRLHLELESRRKTCPLGVPRIRPIDLSTIEKEVSL